MEPGRNSFVGAKSQIATKTPRSFIVFFLSFVFIGRDRDREADRDDDWLVGPFPIMKNIDYDAAATDRWLRNKIAV